MVGSVTHGMLLGKVFYKSGVRMFPRSEDEEPLFLWLCPVHPTVQVKVYFWALQPRRSPMEHGYEMLRLKPKLDDLYMCRLYPSYFLCTMMELRLEDFPWYQQPNTSIVYVLNFFLILKGSNWNKFEARWGHGPCESLQLAPFLALKCFSLLFDWPWCLMLIVYDRLHGHTDF